MVCSSRQNLCTTPFYLATFGANFPETNVDLPRFVTTFFGRQAPSLGMTDSIVDGGFYFVTVANGFNCGGGPAVLYASKSLDSVTCVADLSILGLTNMEPDDVAVGPDNRFLYVTMSPNNLVLRVELQDQGSTTYTLTVAKGGTGSGTVGGGGNYVAGATVTLTVTPASDSTFAGWSPSPCATLFTMPASALTCTATFNAIAPNIPKGDFNGDGRADILWQNPSTWQVATWSLNGAMISGGASLPTGAPNWYIRGVADFNGDGQPDILWQNPTTWQVATWYLNGPNIIGGDFLPTGAPDWYIKGVADFNGDGQPDILWQNTTTWQVATWYLNGPTIIGGDALPTGAPGWNIVLH